METTIKDLQYFKLSPSLIVLLKCIHNKDNSYLIELNKVSDVFTMAKHLEKLNFIKIIGSGLSYESFEIRKLTVIEYLSLDNSKSVDIARNIFDYFIEVSEEYTNKKSRLEFKTNRDFLKGRVNQGVTYDNAKSIINKKFKEWFHTDYRKHLNFQTLLGPKHYNQYLQQVDVEENIEDNDFNTVKA